MNENTNKIYRVSAYYDMDIDVDEEILIEIYATEELAQQRCRQLIDEYKEEWSEHHRYANEWDEDEYRLYAYEDSRWNVDISYREEPVRTSLEKQPL